MHRYLMEVFHFFRGNETFEIRADNKADAVVKGQEYILRQIDSNYRHDSVKCLRKLKPKKEVKSHV